MTGKRMNIVAVLCGLLCALCIFAYTQSVTAQADAARADALARYGGEQIEVCVATKDIAAGEAATASNTTTKLWLADLLPAQAVQSFSEIEGKQATASILAGEVVSKSRFTGAAHDIQVPQGLCAVSVEAKDVQAVGGAISPGCLVDVYAIGPTETVMLASEVLVVASSDSDSGSSKSWVTLAIDPAKVQEFIAATKASEIYFALPANNQKG